MLLRWQQQRDNIQSKVVKTIDAVQKKHLLTNIHIHMEKVLFELKPLKPSQESQAVYQRADDQIQQRIGEFLNRQDSLQNPADIAGHHSIRIASKKLRYTMEICDTAFRGKLKPAIKKVKKIQTILGDMHDCDVWNEDINQFIEKEKKRTMEFYSHTRPFFRILPGLLYLQKERSDHREQLYQQANEYMAQLNEDSFWTTFPEVLRQDKPSEGENQTHVQPDENNGLDGSDLHNSDSV
jgi:CHAD domain-containing protein